VNLRETFVEVPNDDCRCKVYDQYKHLLMIRSDYPLSPIYSFKNLAKRVARYRERTEEVNMVGAEKDIAILGRISGKIKSFDELYQKLLAEVKELQEDLFRHIGFEDEEWISLEVPNQLKDLVNSGDPGYFFGDDDRKYLKKHEDRGLRALLHHPRLKDRYGCMVSRDRFIPNAVACHDFLRRAWFARSRLAELTHISVGGPARGTKFTAQYLCNHPHSDVRHIKVVDGDMCLVFGYNETSSLVRTPDLLV
jgi:hypothetical protein